MQEKAANDAFQEAVNAGADVVKQWDATLDGNTRESHQAVDGQTREVGDKFSNGLMYPGDKNGSAAEVINCRCHLLIRSRKRMNEEELRVLQERAKFFGLDKADEFEKFRQRYLQFAQVGSPFYDVNQNAEVQKYQAKYDEARKRIDELSTINERYYRNPSDFASEKERRQWRKWKKSIDIADVQKQMQILMGKMDDAEALLVDAKREIIGERFVKGTNPNYSTGKYEWTYNCQRCVPTCEARRRGLDVVAEPKIEHGYDELTYNWGKAFVNPQVYATRGSGRTDIEAQMRQWGDGARAEIFVAWNDKNAHVFMAEQIAGTTIYYDPQSGEMNVLSHFSRACEGKTAFMRIDDLEFSVLGKKCFRERRK